MFSCLNESSQNTFPVFRFADLASFGKSLLDGNKDFLIGTKDLLLNQARSEIMMQEHQVKFYNKCINELQQQAYAQRLQLERPSRIY